MSNTKLTEKTLKNMATDKSFQKGIYYYEMNLVNNPVIDNSFIKADVTGTSFPFYEVQINLENPRINHCSCPYDWGGVCKHIIALGLTWLNDQDKFSRLEEKRNNLKMKLEYYFKVLNKYDLVNILTELIQENEDLKFKILNYIEKKEK